MKRPPKDKALCLNPRKQKFNTEKQAKAAAWHVLRNRGTALAVYGNCPCGYFHFTKGKLIQKQIGGRMEFKIIPLKPPGLNKRQRKRTARDYGQIAAWENEGGSYQ